MLPVSISIHPQHSYNSSGLSFFITATFLLSQTLIDSNADKGFPPGGSGRFGLSSRGDKSDRRPCEHTAAVITQSDHWRVPGAWVTATPKP